MTEREMRFREHYGIDDERSGCVSAFCTILVVIALLLCITIISACKTIKVEGGTHKRDSVRIEQRVDTFMLRVTDSVTIQLPCSDSIEVAYIDRWHTETVYKTRDIHDTLQVCKVDSVPYPVEVEKVVVRNSPFAKFCVWWTIGSLLLIAVSIYRKLR